MKVVAGTFMLPASDIDMYFGIGFIPDWVKMMSPNANEQFVLWSIHMARHASTIGGIEIDDDGSVSANTQDIGVQPWRGGNAVTSAQATAGNCLTWDRQDYSKSAIAGSSYEDINKWTFYSGYTGTFNQGCNTTYVGVGSQIWIDGKRYWITALSNDGNADGEVTINETGIISGQIDKITSMYDFKTMSANDLMPAGFWIDSTVDLLTATSEIGWLEAGQYDRS